PSSRAVWIARVRSSASPASCGVFANCRRITSAPDWITTCQCFFSGFHSTLASPVCVIVLLQPQITWESRQREGFMWDRPFPNLAKPHPNRKGELNAETQRSQRKRRENVAGRNELDLCLGSQRKHE